MQETLFRLSSELRDQLKRQNAASAARQKLAEMNKIVPYVSLNEEESKLYSRASLSFFFTSFAGLFVFKRFLTKSFWFISWTYLYMTLVPSYFETILIEKIAEYPTDYGQTVRAVLIFKNHEDPRTQHYEELSSKYRRYLTLKSINK